MSSACYRRVNPYDGYVMWRSMYYTAIKTMSYRDIDRAIDRGEIKYGDMPNSTPTEQPADRAEGGAE